MAAIISKMADNRCIIWKFASKMKHFANSKIIWNKKRCRK